MYSVVTSEPCKPDIYSKYLLTFNQHDKLRTNDVREMKLMECAASYRVFSHDVTVVILVSQNNETAAMLVSQTHRRTGNFLPGGESSKLFAQKILASCPNFYETV